MTTRTVGEEAASTLARAVAVKWQSETARQRVELWSPVIAKAYDAYAEGFPDRVVHIPSHIGDAGGKDVTARELLENFNTWLGRGIVWASLDFATGWGDE